MPKKVLRKLTITIPEAICLPTSRRLSIRMFLALLWRENERLYAIGNRHQLPLTDDDIRNLCRRRFPTSRIVHRFYIKNQDNVNKYRNEFNRGFRFDTVLNYEDFDFISFRYDHYGERVDSRLGRVALTEEQQHAILVRGFQDRRDAGVYLSPAHMNLLSSVNPAHDPSESTS